MLRDCGAAQEGDLEVAEDATPADVLAGLDLDSGLPWIVCVNGRPARGTAPLAEGDQLYVFLPVSGG